MCNCKPPKTLSREDSFMSVVSSGVILCTGTCSKETNEQTIPLAVASVFGAFSVDVEPDNADEATLLKQDKEKTWLDIKEKYIHMPYYDAKQLQKK